MKKIAAALFVLVNFGLLSLSASADTLTLVSVGGASAGGVYIYPYNMSINGASATTAMMCVDFNHEITFGETWHVTANSVPTDNSQASIDDRALAIIFFEMQTGLNGYSVADYQYAAWGVRDAAGLAGNGSYDATAQAIHDAALALAAGPGTPSLPGFSYGSYTFYTPTSDQNGWTNGIPQEFITNSPVPEPSSLLLMGTGVLGIAGLVRRKVAA